MKKTLLSLFLLLLFTSCKKDHVDASSTRSFQSSINDMTSSLPTIKQIKFNEALYILKTFGIETNSDSVKANSDSNELKALGQLLDGKKIPEIFAMADQIALQNGIDWNSTSEPSLGKMNIFENVAAKESDPNDIKADRLDIITKSVASDSATGVKAIQILPKLLDKSGNTIFFTGATLETTMEVFSNGNKLITAKNLMLNNDFKGFNLRFASLPSNKIIDNKIDITVSVKTTDKTLRMSKIGIKVNPKTLSSRTKKTIDDNSITTDKLFKKNLSAVENPSTTFVKDPKTTVTRFLSNLKSQNLKDAYDISANPDWESYHKFSNPISGFGAVKNLTVKSIITKTTSDNLATVNAMYDVTDKNDKTTALSVTFGLKNINGEWKISNYKIN